MVANRLSFLRLSLNAVMALAFCFVAVAAVSADEAADKVLEEKILKVIREHPKEIMQAVVGYQRAQAEQRMKSAETQLRDKVAQLKSDELLGDSPTRGKAGSKLVLVEFSDFQCPYCGKAFETVQQFMAAHEQEVLLVYKHLPLAEMHPAATGAALAAWAAQQQGKFWEFHNAMFKGQDHLGEALYTDTAKSLGLDLERFNKDRVSEAASAAIQRDLDVARKLDIQATPQFLLNARPITGAAPLEEFEKVLGEARAEVK